MLKDFTKEKFDIIIQAGQSNSQGTSFGDTSNPWIPDERVWYMNENDTISITELMFTDNDELSGLIASMMGAQALIILSNIDGVYDGDPSLPESKVILDIYHDASLDTDSFIQTKKSSFGRGGMGSKYRISHKVAEEGIDVIIANGRRDNILLEIASGKRAVPYTMFHANADKVSSVKKWIAHSDGFAKGQLKVNQGAYDALLAGATSLLAVGVTEVMGEFDKDDIVQVISPGGEEFAVGRVGVDSDKARSMIGKKGERPLIHYDYLYIF
jgi:glutamate 5-kinase